MDPFLGIGHSSVAAKQCGIGKFIGFDIDVDYVEVARNAVTKGLTEPTADLAQFMARDRKKSLEGQKTFF